MSASKPDTYRAQDGCHNCRHCIVHMPCDDPVYYFCALDAPARPVEPPNYDEFNTDDESPSYKHRWALFGWVHDLPEVEAAGICDFNEKRAKENV